MSDCEWIIHLLFFCLTSSQYRLSLCKVYTSVFFLVFTRWKIDTVGWFAQTINVRMFCSSAACVLFWRKNDPSFAKNDPSFCEKWLVVLWKTSRRFVESRKWTRRHRKEVKKKVGEDGIFMRENEEWIRRVKNMKWWVRDSSRARVHTHVCRSFCVFAVTSVTVVHVIGWNIVEYVVFFRVCLLLESWNKEKRVENRRWRRGWE